MGEDQGQVGTPVGGERSPEEQKSPGEQKSPEQLEREIEETRQNLGDTAAALAGKADFKTRAREKAEDIKRTVADKKESFASSAGGAEGGGGAAAQVTSAATQAKATAQENPVATAAVAGFVGGFLLGRITSR